MIVSASRRTDIPAYYAEWFFRRIREGFVLVPNPRNPSRISRISLSPEGVDGFVFWTKDPRPMLSRLAELADYPYYFQFTLNGYGRDVEGNLPSKKEVLVPAFQDLAGRIGREGVVWRYDPILLSERYTLSYHIECFQRFCHALAPYTEQCTLSFLDLYPSIRRRVEALGIRAPSQGEMEELAGRLGEIGREYGIALKACAEAADLRAFGIERASCIDPDRLARIGKCSLRVERDKNQRSGCGCAASVDIGAYNCCGHDCVYCYANFSQALVSRRQERHDPSSPLLLGRLSPGDQVREKEMKSYRSEQLSWQ